MWVVVVKGEKRKKRKKKKKDQPMSIKGCKKQFIVKRLIDNLHDSRSRNARGDHWIGEPRKNDNSFVEANQNEQITRGRGHSEKRVKRNNNGFERAVSK